MPISQQSWRKPKRKKKRRAALKDPQSTGRKEAARLYPLDRNELCEWSEDYIREHTDQDILLNVPIKEIVHELSGGKHAIQPCIDNPQRARHHGPDKSTLNNEEGNVHRICHNCHNLWHAVNDPDYDPANPHRTD